MKLVRRFLLDEVGVTAIEYALIAGLIGVVVIVWGTTMGTTLNDMFVDISDELVNAG
jgi:pilus assembly protein Flp/PilA